MRRAFLGRGVIRLRRSHDGAGARQKAWTPMDLFSPSEDVPEGSLEGSGQGRFPGAVRANDQHGPTCRIGKAVDHPADV
jgi:hypothetical protein